MTDLEKAAYAWLALGIGWVAWMVFWKIYEQPRVIKKRK